MGSSTWAQLMILLLLALALVHYRNEKLSAIDREPGSARGQRRITASLATNDDALTALRNVAEAPRVALAATPTPAPQAITRQKPRGPLNGPYYRVDPERDDVDYKHLLGHQRMLCESRRQNFWLCQEVEGVVIEENGPVEPAVFCRDCYGNTVPRLLARDLGNDLWN